MKGFRLLFAALAVGVLLLASACSSDSNVTGSGNKGNFLVTLTSEGSSAASVTTSDLSSGVDTGVALGPADHDSEDLDDPIRKLSEVSVTFSSVLGRNLDGQLIDVDIDLPRTIDLMSIINGGEVSLPVGFLPPGVYDQLVVVMTAVELVTLNGTSIEITPPGGGWTAVVDTCAFEVIDGETTTIRIRFRPRHSIKQLLNGDFHFDPHFDCDEAQ